MIDLGIGNFLTLITEFIAIRTGLGFFGVPPWAAVLAALALLYTALMTHRYWTWERITLAIAVFNFVFIPVALLTHPDWHSVGHALTIWKPLPRMDKDTLLIVLADIGATVTPWMLFFQQSATVDKGMTKRDVRFGRLDTVLGAALPAAAAVATVIATTPLFTHHMSAEHFQAAEFAQALEPLIGRVGASLFALGIVEAGMVACVTISISSAYAFGEVGGQTAQPQPTSAPRQSFLLRRVPVGCSGSGHRAHTGAAARVRRSDSERDWVLAMPPALVFLFMLANDRELMGDVVSPLWANVLTTAVVIFLVSAGVLFGISVVAPNLFAALGR